MYAMSLRNIIRMAITKNKNVCQVNVMNENVLGSKFLYNSHPLTIRPINMGQIIRFGLKLLTIFSTTLFLFSANIITDIVTMCEIIIKGHIDSNFKLYMPYRQYDTSIWLLFYYGILFEKGELYDFKISLTN